MAIEGILIASKDYEGRRGWGLYKVTEVRKRMGESEQELLYKRSWRLEMEELMLNKHASNGAF